MRVPVLRSCFRFFRSRLRESFGFHQRFRAKLHGDRGGEIRAWKLFALTPIMLLHKPKGVGSVGRIELVHRADMFARESWLELILQACQSFAAVPLNGGSPRRNIVSVEAAFRFGSSKARYPEPVKSSQGSVGPNGIQPHSKSCAGNVPKHAGGNHC